MAGCYCSKRKGGRGIIIKKEKDRGVGIKRMFRDGLAGLGKDAEKVKMMLLLE